MRLLSVRWCVPLCLLLTWPFSAPACAEVVLRPVEAPGHRGPKPTANAESKEPDVSELFDGGLVQRGPDRKPGERPVVARAATRDGLVLGFAEHGELTAVSAGGKPIGGTAPGGFWIRDVAADGPWLRIQGQMRQDGKRVRFEGAEPTAGLRLNATFEPTADTIHVSGVVTDTTGEDRAVTVCFVLPLVKQPRVWHDDIVRSTPAVAGKEYWNAQGWPGGARLSAYPFASITSENLGLALAAPMDCPRVCRFVYNTCFDVFYVAYDFGLCKEPIRYPSRADFRFALYRHSPAWGFRAATQGYYNRFAQFFQQRLKRGGIWMAFGDIGKVERFEDFGFAYHEGGDNFHAFDDAHGIACFHYVEPMTYWLKMDKRYPRTYEGALQALADNAASGNPRLAQNAQATQRCAAFTRDGRLDLDLRDRPWCDGAVFTLNPDPKLPEDAACPTNRGHLGYSKDWADKNLPPPPGALGRGMYIDSMPNWGEVRNWRREHWRTVEIPLTFDDKTKKPMLLQIFSTWQFVKWVADDVRARGGVMHGNGGAMWPYFPALVDITGQETEEILSDAAMAMARTLMRNKPYSPLLNTHFDTMGEGLVEDYFNASLLYGIFPSFFDGTYAKDGKWVTVRYFSDPKFYNRDRELYRKYIPILRQMFAAGWQVVTYARAEPAGVRVERYGPTARGELLFAVYNPSAAAINSQLVVDAAGLGLKVGHPATTALVGGQRLECRQADARIEVSLPLGARKCEVIRLVP